MFGGDPDGVVVVVGSVVVVLVLIVVVVGGGGVITVRLSHVTKLGKVHHSFSTSHHNPSIHQRSFGIPLTQR
jgi:hypothetical protein